MAYRDILLHLDSYPDPTPPEVVDEAVQVCAALGGVVTAAAFQVLIPVRGNFLADRLIGLAGMVKEEEARSAENAARLLARFEAQADKACIKHQRLSLREDELNHCDRLADLARTHDICVVPYFGDIAAQTVLVEALVFGAGRPVLIFRSGTGGGRPRAFKRILIAWDGGRPASRAVADAMPLLRETEEVRILTILGDKPATFCGQATTLLRHLAAHGVKAEAEEYASAGRSAGEILGQVADERGFDLLVMGAYGHSRLREFLLGGATQHVLTVPPVPVLLSH